MESHTRNSGFASMDRHKQREIARQGGKAAHRKGTAHEFNSEEARNAGRKGGQRVASNRGHMSEIGKLGGRRSAERRRNKLSASQIVSSNTSQLQNPAEGANGGDAKDKRRSEQETDPSVISLPRGSEENSAREEDGGVESNSSLENTELNSDQK